jgi:glycosyltransferase involved in cell wall biosynthesis
LHAAIRLSIVIPTHNRHAQAARAVKALSAQIVGESLASSVEVLVVDDGSEPACAERTRDFIRQQNQAFLRYLELPHNQGASAARNAGALASRGAIVAFLDDDIVPADHYVSAIIRSHQDHPDALVINGNLRPMERSIYADFWFHYYSPVFNRPGERFYPIAMLGSGNVSMKRALLARENPLFDPSLTSREDFDLYLRLKAQGIPSYKDDTIQAFNECRHTLVSFLKQRMWYGRGQQQLIAKHGNALDLAQAIAPPKRRFFHLYLLLRLARIAARGHAAGRRVIAVRAGRA